MMEIDLEKLKGHDPCEFAKERWNDIAMWRNLWTVLLFIFCAFLLLTLGAALLFALFELPIGGIIAGAAAIVEGGALTFIVARRRNAVKEEELAYKDVTDQCSVAVVAQADVARKEMSVFGMR